MRVIIVIALCAALCPAAQLPGRYHELLKAGLAPVAEALAQAPQASLQELERRPGWRHFPSAMLAAAVLYSKERDPKMLALAEKIGGIAAEADEKGAYTTRLDHHRDTYMWLETYRVLEKNLGPATRERWRKLLAGHMTSLAQDVARRQDYPWYNSPYIGTSPNHYSLWSSTLYLAGVVFQNQEWRKLGGRVMHRFAAEEQAPDGYWGEHGRNGPTTGYDFLTSTAVALYWEHSKDPAAREALRRNIEFHKYFTWPDGDPVETVNDRNRYWTEKSWGHFGFSNFPDGRRYAEFLTSFFKEDRLSIEEMSRLAQNALYFHAGPKAPVPLDQRRFAYSMKVPAMMRKEGAWLVCLSGIVDTTTPLNRYYIDRQGNVSLFHEKLGLVVTGAGSKGQPELATFAERATGQVFTLPMSSRLWMGDRSDRLALAFNTFFSVLEAAVSEAEVSLRFDITPKGRLAEGTLNLQLCLKPGQELETGSGKKVTLDSARVELGPAELGGWVKHNGWTIRVDSNSTLVWPVLPYSPYAGGPEKSLRNAVGALATPLRPGPISFAVTAN